MSLRARFAKTVSIAMVSRQERSFPEKFLEGKVMLLGRTGEKAGPCATSHGTWLSHDVEGDEEDGELALGEPGEEHSRVREDWTDWLQL